MATTSTAIELQSPPTAQSILVLEGFRMTQDQVARIREQIDAAIASNTWPVILNSEGPVYWLPVEPPPLREFVEWIVSRRRDRSILQYTLSEIYDKAEAALRKADGS
jgi:hypothetical protein